MLADLRDHKVGWYVLEYAGANSLVHRQTTVEFPGGVPRNYNNGPGAPLHVSDGLIEAIEFGV
jgi:hypothetical protein